MLNRILAVVDSYRTRPLMVVTLVVIVLVTWRVVSDGTRTVFRAGYPFLFWASASETLASAEQFRHYAQSGETNERIRCIDFSRMRSTLEYDYIGSGTEAEITDYRPLSDSQHVLLQFPNVELIRFHRRQLMQIDADTLLQMPRLRAISISELHVDREIFERIASVPSIEALDLRTLQISGIDSLQSLPNLHTLVLRHDSYNPHADLEGVGAFHHTNLESIAQLKSLKKLVLAPSWYPSSADLSNQPDFADATIKHYAIESLSRPKVCSNCGSAMRIVRKNASDWKHSPQRCRTPTFGLRCSTSNAFARFPCSRSLALAS